MKLLLTNTTTIESIKALNPSDTIIISKEGREEQVAALISAVRVELLSDCSDQLVKHLPAYVSNFFIPNGLSDSAAQCISADVRLSIGSQTEYSWIKMLQVNTVILPIHEFSAYYFIAENSNVTSVDLTLNDTVVCNVQLDRLSGVVSRLTELFSHIESHLIEKLTQKATELEKLKSLRDEQPSTVQLSAELSNSHLIIAKLQSELAELKKNLEVYQQFDGLPDLYPVPSCSEAGSVCLPQRRYAAGAEETWENDDTEVKSPVPKFATHEQCVTNDKTQVAAADMEITQLVGENVALVHQLGLYRKQCFDLSRELIWRIGREMELKNEIKALHEGKCHAELYAAALYDEVHQLRAIVHQERQMNKRGADSLEETHATLAAPPVVATGKMRPDPTQHRFFGREIKLIDGLTGRRHSAK